MMRLLISVVDAAEAQQALRGGAQIIDVKNPAEGALGAAPPVALREVCALLPASCASSAALGESVDHQPGLLALAAFGAVTLGAQYVKLGLRSAAAAEALALLRALRQGAQLANPACQVMAVGYADSERIGALAWHELPKIAQAAGIDGCMIDTALKDGHGLFDYCATPDLVDWLAACRARGLRGALAGALRADDIPQLLRLRPDVVGFRSAACAGDRVTGQVEARLVANLARRLGI